MDQRLANGPSAQELGTKTLGERSKAEPGYWWAVFACAACRDMKRLDDNEPRLLGAVEHPPSAKFVVVTRWRRIGAAEAAHRPANRHRRWKKLFTTLDIHPTWEQEAMTPSLTASDSRFVTSGSPVTLQPTSKDAAKQIEFRCSAGHIREVRGAGVFEAARLARKRSESLIFV